MSRNEKLLFIKKFRLLNFSNILKRANVTRQAVATGRISDEKIDTIIEIIESDIAKLWEK